nr:cyclin-D-binding Myb-like transcription factor 1 [Parasteatoda tepidariorum]
MNDLYNNPFVELRQRINEIKKKNINLSKKFKKCGLRKNSIQNLEMIEKSKVLDETEVSMVEDCYRKALELAEYHLRRKKAKKQQKLNMVHKTKAKGSNKHTAISSYDSNSVKIGNSKSFPTTLWKTENLVGKIESENTNVANYLSSQLGSFINQNVDIPSPHFKNIKEKRKKLKLQSSSSVQDSCFLKPAARKSKPAPVTANCGNQANTKNTFSVIQKIKNNLSPSDMPKTHDCSTFCKNSTDETSTNSQKNFQCPIITLNDTAEKKHFTNKPLNILKEPFRPIVPELDLKQKSTTKTTIEEIYLAEEKGILEELDLTEEFDEAVIPELDLTEEPVEIIVPELDLSEEPVDFPIPKLHMKESVNLLSEELKSKLKSEGVVIKNGKWSNKEKDLLRRNFEDFQSQFGVYNSNLLLGIGRNLPSNKYEYSWVKKFLKAKHFYVRLGKDINDRMLGAIYCKARRMFNILKNSKDCTANDITNIIKLQKIYGNNWSLIGQKLGIDSYDCCSFYLFHKKPVKKGPWSETEIKQLILAIKSVTKVSIISAEHLNGISWRKVSDLVPTRNQKQCLREWQINQSKLFQNALYEEWTVSDTEKLINLLKSNYHVTDECDILWTEVQKSFKNVIHSECALKRKWSSIKRYAPKEIRNNFPQLIDFLHKKYMNDIY